MKHKYHLFIGLAIGVLQYLLIIGLSYAMVLNKTNAVQYLFSMGLVVFVSFWNILYKTFSFETLIIRITSSVLSYLLMLFVFTRLGVVSSLETLFSIGSSSQNLQGFLALSFILAILVTNIIVIFFKCIGFYRAKIKI